MQIDDFEGVVNRGVEFAAHPERLGQVRGLHHRRHASLPRNIGPDDVDDAARCRHFFDVRRIAHLVVHLISAFFPRAVAWAAALAVNCG